VATDGAGNWVAVGEEITTFPGAAHVLFSNDDGANWSAASFPVITTALNTVHGVATDGTSWVLAGQNLDADPVIAISTDGGATWTDPIVMDVDGGHVFDVATDGAGTWVAVGTLYSATTDMQVFWYLQPPGDITVAGDWNQVAVPQDGYLTGVATDGLGTFVVVGRRDDTIGGGLTYTLDVTMTAGTFDVATTNNLHDVATDKAGVWIAVGADLGGGMRTYTSFNNGYNWTVTASPTGSGIALGIATKVLA
jgi:hypothetical protein